MPGEDPEKVTIHLPVHPAFDSLASYLLARPEYRRGTPRTTVQFIQVGLQSVLGKAFSKSCLSEMVPLTNTLGCPLLDRLLDDVLADPQRHYDEWDRCRFVFLLIMHATICHMSTKTVSSGAYNLTMPRPY